MYWGCCRPGIGSGTTIGSWAACECNDAKAIKEKAERNVHSTKCLNCIGTTCKKGAVRDKSLCEFYRLCPRDKQKIVAFLQFDFR